MRFDSLREMRARFRGRHAQAQARVRQREVGAGAVVVGWCGVSNGRAGGGLFARAGRRIGAEKQKDVRCAAHATRSR